MRIFDEEAQAMQSARNSSRMLEEAYSTGVAILSRYSEQREHLKVSAVLDIYMHTNMHTCDARTDTKLTNQCQTC